jgi:hypothetical protein
MYAGMNSWCPDEPPTLVSQTRQEEEEEKGSLKETYSSYIYKILKQIYSDTGISNKARRRRERKSKRRYISLTCTNLTLVSQTSNTLPCSTLYQWTPLDSTGLP